MKRTFIFLLLSACFILAGCERQAAVTFENPVIPHNCPDPSILDNRARDGFFYAYSTRAKISGNVYEIPVYKSPDLVSWELVGAAFTHEGRPSWEPDGVLWAPDINYIGGQYVLYYAVGVWGDHDRSASGVAVSDSPAGPFKDLGMLVSMENTGVGNSIDPNYFEDTDGRKYLYWGSLRHRTDKEAGRKSGIHVIELSEDGLSFKPGTEPVKVAGDLMEGVYVHKRGNYYYLFASEGSCCEGAESTYHIVVGRSESPFGPFVSRSGKSMISGDEGVYDEVILVRDPDKTFCGPGHDAEIMTDDKGQDWMAYHAYWKGNDYSGRCMNLDRVCWTKDGWPYFKDGAPSLSSEAPVFKN
ncbi:MAG: family 43 glycosylhydrolase [Bacteroidales bacterium]|nr:family 43 glycosylhydrolase [Bacteroidales bacterium]